VISLFASKPVLEPLLDEIAARQRAVLDSGRFILGPEVEAFETEFAAAVGREHCVGVANGTDAITIALRAMGVGTGDEVIVPAFTFFATPEAVVNAGATPVFCDIDPVTDCMTAEQVEPLITDRTRAIVPVHIFGNVAPMSELMALAEQRDMRVLGDAAQAVGALLDGRPAAAYGDAATFSFYPSKNLGAFGDAGAIVTDSEEIADAARRLRFHGTLEKGFHHDVGFNSRLDEMQAAGLRVVLPHMVEWNSLRRAAADAYREAGLGELVELPPETEGAESAYHLYAVRLPDRDRLRDELTERGVGSRPYYDVPMHKQPAMRPWVDEGLSLPNAERLGATNLALPMGPALTAEDAQQVVAAVREAGVLVA
jgi:dTDP-4-amino-4,6-dideoxygalactose transaminase